MQSVDASSVGALVNYALRNREFMRPFEPSRSEDFYTFEGMSERIGQAAAGKNGEWFGWLALDDAGEVVGQITISNVVRGAFQSANLGYSVDQAHNAKGIATAMVAHVIRAAFTEIHLHRLEAGTLVDNIGSQRVLEKNGFRQIGLSPNHLHIAGSWQDHILYTMTAEIFSAR